MTPHPFPARPNLEQLKKQAKSLLRAAQTRDTEALRRLAALPAFASLAADAIASKAALHDAQSVIAREHGFSSWAALREEVETQTLSFDEAVNEFVRCATGGASGRAERLLARHPGIASATLHAALVLGDATAVSARLAVQPDLATTPGGPQNWEPLLYVCHTSVGRTTPAQLEGLVRIARDLLALGANPNAEYHWNWHPELPRTALWGATCVVRHLPLAETLLEAGANPTDGVTSHIAGGGGNLDILDLLLRHGLGVNGIAGGVPPLVYMMQWSDNPAGPFWLLDHGADPNLAWGEAGEAPLHVAARRWTVPMVQRLVASGADPAQRSTDGTTPHTLAELNGNHDIAVWLLAHGAADELTPLERFIAACARADKAAADALLQAHPGLARDLRPEHHLMLQRHAESGNIPPLATMLACGFDPNVPDKDRVTSLHRAAMSGSDEAVRVLLDAGADVHALDGMFAATPLIWAVEGRSYARPGADHVAVARRLIAAGSSIEWVIPEGAPDVERTLDALAELVALARADAGQVRS